MSIVNRRNAVIGWLVWMAGKSVAKQKARKAVPAVQGGRPNKPAAALAGLAAAGGALLFWRRRRRAGADDDAAAAGPE
jgi:LPXTG-motif cell wall-anchored protein